MNTEVKAEQSPEDAKKAAIKTKKREMTKTLADRFASWIAAVEKEAECQEKEAFELVERALKRGRSVVAKTKKQDAIREVKRLCQRNRFTKAHLGSALSTKKVAEKPAEASK